MASLETVFLFARYFEMQRLITEKMPSTRKHQTESQAPMGMPFAQLKVQDI